MRRFAGRKVLNDGLPPGADLLGRINIKLDGDWADSRRNWVRRSALRDVASAHELRSAQAQHLGFLHGLDVKNGDDIALHRRLDSLDGLGICTRRPCRGEVAEVGLYFNFGLLHSHTGLVMRSIEVGSERNVSELE